MEQEIESLTKEPEISDEEKEQKILLEIHNKNLTKKERTEKAVELMELKDLPFKWNITKASLTFEITEKRIQDYKRKLRGISDERIMCSYCKEGEADLIKETNKYKLFSCMFCKEETKIRVVKEAGLLYNGDLKPETRAKTPILQPVEDSNDIFKNLQQKINEFTLNYNKTKEDIEERVAEFPIYSKTFVGREIERFVNNFGDLFYSVEQQQQSFIKAINKMIDLSKDKNGN